MDPTSTNCKTMISSSSVGMLIQIDHLGLRRMAEVVVVLSSAGMCHACDAACQDHKTPMVMKFVVVCRFPMLYLVLCLVIGPCSHVQFADAS